MLTVISKIVYERMCKSNLMIFKLNDRDKTINERQKLWFLWYVKTQKSSKYLNLE